MQFCLAIAGPSVGAGAPNQSESLELGTECYCMQHWVQIDGESLQGRGWNSSMTLGSESSGHVSKWGMKRSVCCRPGCNVSCGEAVMAGWGWVAFLHAVIAEGDRAQVAC